MCFDIWIVVIWSFSNRAIRHVPLLIVTENQVINGRSYAVMKTRNDHRLVVAIMKAEIPIPRTKPKTGLPADLEKLHDHSFHRNIKKIIKINCKKEAFNHSARKVESHSTSVSSNSHRNTWVNRENDEKTLQNKTIIRRANETEHWCEYNSRKKAWNWESYGTISK